MSREDQGSTLTDVAGQVRDFYERYPYPRPIDRLDKYRQLWQDRNRRRGDYHLFWPARSYSEDRSILIAGCGTSQAAKHALRWPTARVIGIDFSATSVRCTENLKRKYGLNNLQVHQLSIERVNDLRMNFDQIVCTGVLHHLADPDLCLRALRGVLKPDGAMHLMVYAPYGRAGIYLLQKFCRRVGIRATEGEIRDLVAALQKLPRGHPLEMLRETPDFQEAAGIADALLNPQDRAYSVQQLFELIKRGGLTFGRWVRQAPYSPRCGIIADIPQASRITQLPLAEQYAAAELFRGTMLSHSVVLYRNDSPVDLQPVNFTDDAWLRYVPIRMSDTICVQERLPPGATGVLINQTHTYKDLILPIDSTEKALFDAIDGNANIDAIVRRALASSPEKWQLDKVRVFFERLWWYDQVVFHTNRSSRS